MARPVTLCTGQFADLPLETLAQKATEWGYDGLELACWGDHMDVAQAAKDKKYCEKQLAILEKNDLQVFAISNHLAGQLVCDPNDDSRSDMFAPEDCSGNAEKKRKWAIKEMKNTAQKAGLRKIRFHDLRHTFASNFVIKGGNLLSLQKILGHSTINMTLRYAHLAPGFMASEIEVLDLESRRSPDGPRKEAYS